MPLPVSIVNPQNVIFALMLQHIDGIPPKALNVGYIPEPFLGKKRSTSNTLIILLIYGDKSLVTTKRTGHDVVIIGTIAVKHNVPKEYLTQADGFLEVKGVN